MEKSDSLELVLVLCAAALVLTTWSRPAQSAEASSEHFHATSVTLVGGGSVALVNPGSGVTARAQVTLGQTEPLAILQGQSTTAELGFWPAVAAVAVPEPTSGLLHVVALLVLMLLPPRNRREAARARQTLSARQAPTPPGRLPT